MLNAIKSFKTLSARVLTSEKGAMTPLHYVVGTVLGVVLTNVAIKSVLTYLYQGYMSATSTAAKGLKDAIVTAIETTSVVPGDAVSPMRFGMATDTNKGNGDTFIECGGATGNEMINALAQMMKVSMIQSLPDGNVFATESTTGSDVLALGTAGLIKTGISLIDNAGVGVSAGSATVGAVDKNVIFVGALTTTVPATVKKSAATACANVNTDTKIPAKLRPYADTFAKTGTEIISSPTGEFALQFVLPDFAQTATI